MGTSEREDWKERNQNESQELHIDSRQKVVRELKGMRKGERKGGRQETGSTRSS